MAGRPPRCCAGGRATDPISAAARLCVWKIRRDIILGGGVPGYPDRPDGKTGQFNPRLAGCRVIVDDGSSQRIATIAGTGISMNSLWSVHRELADGSLIRVLPDYEVDDRSALWLVYPKSNVLTAKVRIFIDYLMEEIGASPAWLEG